MAPDERFKKYQEAGADFLETARARAEEFLQELSKAGESRQRQGRDALDDLLGGSRKGTEQMITSIRKEIRSQLSLLGLATKEDLAALERRLAGSGATAKRTGATAKRASTTKTASATKGASTRKSAGSKSAQAKKAAATKAAAKSTGKRAATTKATAKKTSASKKTTGRA